MFKQIGKGSFSAEVTGCNHCGPNHESPKIFHYEVYVEYPTNHRLDRQGFLLDNTAFQHYFNDIKVVEESCEKTAFEAWKYFAALAPKACIEVCIWGIPEHACVSFKGYGYRAAQYDNAYAAAHTAVLNGEV